MALEHYNIVFNGAPFLEPVGEVPESALEGRRLAPAARFISLPDICEAHDVPRSLFLTSTFWKVPHRDVLVPDEVVVAGLTTSGVFDVGVLKAVRDGICLEHYGRNTPSLLWSNIFMVHGPLADWALGKHNMEKAVQTASVALANMRVLTHPPLPMRRTNSGVHYGAEAAVDLAFWASIGVEVRHERYAVSMGLGLLQPLTPLMMAGAADGGGAGAAAAAPCLLHRAAGRGALGYSKNSDGHYATFAPLCTCEA